MGLSRLIFPSKGPMMGQYCSFMAKYSNLYGRFLFYLLFFTDSASYFRKILFISLVGILNHSRMGVGMVTFTSKVTCITETSPCKSDPKFAPTIQ